MNASTPPSPRTRVRDLDRQYVRAKEKADRLHEQLREAVAEADAAVTAYRNGTGPDPGYSFADVVADLAQNGQSRTSRSQLERWARGITTGKRGRARPGHEAPSDAAAPDA